MTEPAASKRKAVELLHAEVETIDPDQYASHKQLKALEAKLDSTIERHVRQLDMLIQAPPKMIRKTLKVSFYYSFVPSVKLEGEVHAAPSEGHADQVHRSELLDDGEWTFRVEGTIIDGNKNAACQSTAKKFSHFFRKAILDLDDQLYPGSNPIEWSSFRSGDDSDGFSISRPGKKGFQTHRLRLQLLRNQSPERFALSPDLFNAISPYLTPNCGPDDTFVKADISFALWQYIKEKDLMKTDDCRVISHDEVLQRVFECHEQPIHAIMGSLQTKLTPVGPTVIDFTLQLEDTTQVCLDTKYFSIEVQAQETLLHAQKRALAGLAAHRKRTKPELDLLEHQMADVVHRINGHVATREWMHQFATDPSGFMTKVVESQDTDNQILSMATQATPVPAHLHDSNLYAQPWVHSTIDMVLARDGGGGH